MHVCPAHAACTQHACSMSEHACTLLVCWNKSCNAYFNLCERMPHGAWQRVTYPVWYAATDAARYAARCAACSTVWCPTSHAARILQCRLHGVLHGTPVSYAARYAAWHACTVCCSAYCNSCCIVTVMPYSNICCQNVPHAMAHGVGGTYPSRPVRLLPTECRS